jgi:2-polyprenyl-6-methoxyphenol hydroxylase-like FAD-dependent oxidoreductase
MRILIVGSGIAGLSAALALRKVGFEVAVYERAPELREVGAGISLWANALKALDVIGVGNAIRAVSLGMTRSEMRARDGQRVQLSYSAEYFEKQFGVHPFVAMIHRADLVGTLATFLPAGTAKYGFGCSGVEQHGERVTVHFANGHQDEADLVIGADGLNSAVRTAILGPEPSRYSGYTCWRGVCPRPSTIEPGYLAEWWGRGRRFGITTLPGDRVYWFATLNAPAGEHAIDERAVVAEQFATWADPVPALIAATPPERVLRNDIFDRLPARTWSKGRIGLIGDAAHPTTPNLGQGGCMAIEDAVVLARNLKAHADPVRALEAFAAERRERTSAIVKESWHFGRLGQLEGRWSCAVRDRVLGFVMPRVAMKSIPKHATFDVGTLA